VPISVLKAGSVIQMIIVGIIPSMGNIDEEKFMSLLDRIHRYKIQEIVIAFARAK
jgi:hypothetical protein